MTRQERFEMAKKLAESKKVQSRGNFEKADEMAYVALKEDTPVIVRVVGESMEMHQAKSDCVVVNKSFCKNDNGKWVNIIWGNEPNNLLNSWRRSLIGKYSYDKSTKTYTYENPNRNSLKRYLSNGTNNPFDKGMAPTKSMLMNVIDRSDNWCENNKHTKILAWDVTKSEKDGVIKEYPQYGVRMSVYNSLWTDICNLRGQHFEDFDIAIVRLSKSKRPNNTTSFIILTDEDKSKCRALGVDSTKFVDGLLTQEEQDYERYDLEDIPYTSKPSSAFFMLKNFEKLIKMGDLENGTNFYDQFVQAKGEELEAYKKAHPKPDTEETKSTVVQAPVAKVEEPVVEDDGLDFQQPPVVEKKPLAPKMALKKPVQTVDWTLIEDTYETVKTMSAEDKAKIIGIDEETGELKFNVSAEYSCPSCGLDLPQVSTCPYCGEIFE